MILRLSGQPDFFTEAYHAGSIGKIENASTNVDCFFLRAMAALPDKFCLLYFLLTIHEF